MDSDASRRVPSPVSALSRREILKGAGAAGAAALLGARPGTGTGARAAGRPFQAAVASVSAQTVRIRLSPLEDGSAVPIPHDGALVQESWGAPLAGWSALTGAERVRAGELTVELTPEPLTVRILGDDEPVGAAPSVRWRVGLSFSSCSATAPCSVSARADLSSVAADRPTP
jgi:hypothetical protein